MLAHKLRIAFITYKFGHQYGGAEAYGVELIRELAKRHEITVLAYAYDAHCGLNLPFIKIKVSQHWPSWIRAFLFAWQSAQITRRGNFDLVHSQMNGWNGDIDVFHVRSVRYRWFNQKPFLKRLLNSISPRIQMYCWLEKKRLHTVPPRRTVVASETLKSQLQLAYQTDFPIDVITPGVHLPSPDPQARRRQRNALGLSPDDYLCLLVARSPQKKGLPTLLKALPLLPATIKLLVVGSTKQERRNLQQRFQKLGLAQRVLCVPQTTNITPYYQAADLCVHPTLNDSFGMAPLEAMSHGLPVIMSSAAHCGFAQYLTHAKQAWLLQDPTDPIELSHAIKQLVTNPGLAHKLRQGADQILSKFSWPHVAQQYEQIYQDFLASTQVSDATEGISKKSVAKRSA